MLGVRLLDRNSRGVEPTIYGRRLLNSSYAIFDELRQGVIEIEHLSDPAAGELSIGSNEASMLGIVPSVIQKIRRKHPRLFIQVTPANTFAEQRLELSQRRIEFAIGALSEALPDRDFETELLFEQRLFVVASVHNPWTRRSQIKLADLMGDPWIMPSPAGPGGRLAADVFAMSGLEMPHSSVVTSSFQLTHRLLEDGPFLALLPASALPSLTKTLSVHILPVELSHRTEPIGIVKLRNRTLSPVAEIFIGAARLVASSIPSKSNEFVGMAD